MVDTIVPKWCVGPQACNAARVVAILVREATGKGNVPWYCASTASPDWKPHALLALGFALACDIIDILVHGSLNHRVRHYLGRYTYGRVEPQQHNPQRHHTSAPHKRHACLLSGAHSLVVWYGIWADDSASRPAVPGGLPICSANSFCNFLRLDVNGKFISTVSSLVRRCPYMQAQSFREVWCWHRRLHCAALVYNAIIHRKQLIMHNKSGTGGALVEDGLVTHQRLHHGAGDDTLQQGASPPVDCMRLALV